MSYRNAERLAETMAEVLKLLADTATWLIRRLTGSASRPRKARRADLTSTQTVRSRRSLP